MKKLTIATCILSIVILTAQAKAYSANPSSVVYKCQPAAGAVQGLQIGLDELDAIHSVVVSTTPESMLVTVDAEIVSAVDKANSRDGIVASRKVTEKYEVQGIKNGSMFDLKGSHSNTLSPEYVILHLLDFAAQTAGPIGAGTYDATADLVYISSYPANNQPNTGILKIPLNCKATVKY